MIVYPAILYPPDDEGLSGCHVPDLLVLAAGRDPEAALIDAVEIVQELTDGMARRGEPFPEPTPVAELDLEDGTLVMLPLARPRPVPDAAA